MPLPCLQASSGPFWTLWRLFDMPGGSLANLHLGAALQQVGKVRTRALQGKAPGRAVKASPLHHWAAVVHTGRQAAAGFATACSAPPCGPHAHHRCSRRPSLCLRPQLVGLFLLVTFGCCMDIAAIQQDFPHRLDTNRELAAVGACPRCVCLAASAARGLCGSAEVAEFQAPSLFQGALHGSTRPRATCCSHPPPSRPSLQPGLSNLASGVAGAGFTGSFIFSQSIFTGRAGVHSRINGAGKGGGLPRTPVAVGLSSRWAPTV